MTASQGPATHGTENRRPGTRRPENHSSGRRAPRLHRRTHRPVRAWLVALGLCLGIVVLSITALGVGDYPLNPAEVLAALTGGGGFDSTVVLQWRLPRITAALVFGIALLVNLLAYRDGVQGFRLIVVGIGVTAALHAVNSWILLRAQTETAMGAAIWGVGSLGLTSWSAVLPAIAIVLAALPLLLFSVRPLRQLELGDDVAASHGVRVEPTRLAILGLGVPLIALVTAATGPIAFVALAAPQIARLLARSAGIPLIHSALTGALVLLGSDMIAQQVLAQPIPVGMVTVVLGGGYLAALLAHQARKD